MGLHTREPAVAVNCGDEEDFENDGDDDYSDENDYDYICKYDSSNDRGSGYDKSSDDYSCIDDDSSDDGDDIDNDDDDGGSGDATDNLCAICDNGGKLLCCEGQCKRSFHPRVKDGRESNNCETLGLTSAQLQEIDHYLCKNCEHKQHQCFSCGDLEPSDGPNAKVFQCYKASCGHFYHPSCIAKLLEPDDTDGAHELKKRIAAGMSFTCPAHWCSECRTMEDSTQPDLWLAACRRCPVSYHKKCLPRSISFERKRGTSVRAWHLGDRIIIYCGRHKLEAALGAPSRDHIKLPSSTEMDTVRAHCMDQTKSTPVPKIYRTRNLANKKTEVTGKRKMNTDQGSTGTAELSNKVCREEADHIKLTPVPKIYRTRNLAKKTKVTGKRKMNTDQGSTGTAELSNKVCREEADQIQIVDMNSLREDNIPKGRGVLERETIRLNQAQNDEVEKLIVEEQAEEDENDTKSGKERETHRRENTYGEKENTPGNKSNKFGLTNRRFTSGSDGDREVDGSHACQQELKSPHCNDNHKATGIDTSSDKSGKRQRQEEHATDGNMLNLERNRKKFHMETGRDAHQSPQRLHNHKKPDARQSSCCSSSKNHPLCNDDMAIPESPPKADPKPPSPSTAVEDTVLPDVLITGTGYQSPKPHVLTRHTDKAKANSPEELEFEFPVLEKLSADELHAGYLNRLSTSRNMELKLVGLMKKKYEEALKAADSKLTGVKENLAAQQTARSEAEKKWRVAVKELEKTQADFAAFKKTAESKQAALTKRADDAEGRLKVTSEELQTLKRHIFRMTSAIFGERSRQLSSNSLLKLKAVYSLAEQLYCGTLCTIKAMLTEKSIPKHMKGVIELLSTLPKQIEELKRSSARHGAMAALSRSLAFAPELTAEEMIDGFPFKKDDGSEFTEADYAKCRKASRVLASTLVNEMDLSSYQAAYGEDNKRLRGPTFEARDLTPARRKQLFVPDIDPSFLFDRAQFEALTHCNWDVDNLQIEEVEDPAKDDSPAS